MSFAWNPNVPYIVDGEPESAAVADRPLRAEAQNAQYLKDRVDAASLGECNIAYGVTIDPLVQVGQPVAYDAINQRFGQALAEVVTDSGTHALVPSARAQCLGILVNKSGPSLGDILTSGRYPVSLSSAVVGTPASGLYYLSASTPGMLTSQKPPVASPVLFWDGQFAYFSPTLRDFLEAHTHYSVDLVCAPAGNNIVTNGRHTIPAPDATLPGWLPASHAVFGGQAPVGAIWGYNLARDPNLSAIWPPVPLVALNLYWDKGNGSALGAQLIPGGAIATDIAGLWYADRTTIWWLSDCQGDVPWPAAYNASNPPGPLPLTTTPPTCPRPTAMRLVAGYTQMLFETDKSVVTSLVPGTGSPITVARCDGTPGNTGALALGLNLDFLVSATPVTGSTVLKGLTGATFHEGLVVEALAPGANVSFGHTEGTDALAQGIVTINVATDLAGRELSPEVVRLFEAKERTFNTVLYLGLPAGRASSIRMRFDIPATGLPNNPTISVRLLLFGLATGTLPVTTMSYRILPRPVAGALVTPAASDTSVACNTNLAITNATYLEVSSAAIAVTPGDTLFVTLARNVGDGYSGELGVIRSSGIVGSSG